MKHLLPCCCLLAAASAPILAPAAGSRTLDVTATILERTVVRVVSAPAGLRITPEDVARGEVEAVSPMLVEVDSNAPQGARLSLWLTDGPARSAQVDGPGTSAWIGAQPAQVTVAPLTEGRQRLTLPLRTRFSLRSGVEPGNYAWPLQVQAAQP